VAIQTREAQSPKKGDLTRDDILRLILKRDFGYLLKRNGIKRDLITGWVGERGGGKSGSGAVQSILDFAIDGIPIYSNMEIACDIEIEDERAQAVGLNRGGVVHLAAKPLDMPALLRFDEMYRGSHIFLDEINVMIAESRRAMSNTNLFSNRLAQELRHLQSSISFTCISEMAVDPRWRDIVDCFVRCEETAYYGENIRVHKPIGIDFKWSIYFMNRCFNGTTYYETKKPAASPIFHFKPWQGLYDDKEFQGEGMEKYGVDMRKADGASLSISKLEMKDGKTVIDYRREWGWFEPIAQDLLASRDKFVPASEIYNHPEVLRRNIDKGKLSTHLREYYNIYSRTKPYEGHRQTMYELPDEILGEPELATAGVSKRRN
jgi:hypothetical protein